LPGRKPPDQFEWITQFLYERGLLRSACLIMASVAASASLVPLSFLAGLQRDDAASLTVGVVGAVFTLGLTGYCLTGWPSRRQSETAIVIGTFVVAVWSLAQPTAGVAVLACTATAVTGGYIAFFHGPKVLAFNSVVALSIAIVASYRLGQDSGLPTAVAAFCSSGFSTCRYPWPHWAPRARSGSMQSDPTPIP
jgi:hypothetical protein